MHILLLCEKVGWGEPTQAEREHANVTQGVVLGTRNWFNIWITWYKKRSYNLWSWRSRRSMGSDWGLISGQNFRLREMKVLDPLLNGIELSRGVKQNTKHWPLWSSTKNNRYSLSWLGQESRDRESFSDGPCDSDYSRCISLPLLPFLPSPAVTTPPPSQGGLFSLLLSVSALHLPPAVGSSPGFSSRDERVSRSEVLDNCHSPEGPGVDTTQHSVCVAASLLSMVLSLLSQEIRLGSQQAHFVSYSTLSCIFHTWSE